MVVPANTIDTFEKLKDFIADQTGSREMLNKESFKIDILGEYGSARTAAEGIYSRPALGSGGGGSNPLETLIETIKGHTKGHESLVDSLEGALSSDSRDFKRIIRDNQRELKTHASDLSGGIKEALGAHKQAYRTLITEQASVTKEMAAAYSEALGAASGAAEKAEVTKNFRNAQSAFTSLVESQKATHERAVDHMKDIVETMEEAGVPLKKKFNFNLAEKKVVEGAESAVTKGGEAAADGASHSTAAAEGGSKLPWVLGGAALGAFIANRMKGEDNDSRAPEVMGGIVGGVAGYGTKVWMGGMRKVSEFPELAVKAGQHLHI